MTTDEDNNGQPVSQYSLWLMPLSHMAEELASTEDGCPDPGEGHAWQHISSLMLFCAEDQSWYFRNKKSYPQHAYQKWDWKSYTVQFCFK